MFQALWNSAQSLLLPGDSGALAAPGLLCWPPLLFPLVGNSAHSPDTREGPDAWRGVNEPLWPFAVALGGGASLMIYTKAVQGNGGGCQKSHDAPTQRLVATVRLAAQSVMQ